LLDHPEFLFILQIVTNCKNSSILVSNLRTLGTTLAPAQQRVSSGAAMTPQQSTETILRSGRAKKKKKKEAFNSFNNNLVNIYNLLSPL